MSNTGTENESQLEQASRIAGERVVFVVPDQSLADRANDEIDLRELWRILWRGKWIAFAVAAIFAVASVAYALAQTHWYRAEVLLAPADVKSVPSLGGQLGGLAALAGVSIGGAKSTEAIATLESREFARAFIEEFDLLTVFFAAAWDEDRSEWLEKDPAKWPDIRDAVRFFHDHILTVEEDRQSSLVTLAIGWTDPQIAATWAEEIVHRLNNRLRERALLEAEANVAYLQAELARTNVVTLQESIGRLLESELQKLMLARGSDEFAFRVIDGAEVPKSPSKPRRTMIAVIGTVLGGMIGVISVFLLHAVRRAHKRELVS